jgi:hypothetical protein
MSLRMFRQLVQAHLWISIGLYRRCRRTCAVDLDVRGIWVFRRTERIQRTLVTLDEDFLEWDRLSEEPEQ